MTFKIVAPLLIGELQAGISTNEDGVAYIGIGPITDDDDSHFGIDEIEARALCGWLAMVLGFTLTQPDKS